MKLGVQSIDSNHKFGLTDHVWYRDELYVVTSIVGRYDKGGKQYTIAIGGSLPMVVLEEELTLAKIPSDEWVLEKVEPSIYLIRTANGQYSLKWIPR